jgi:hypothetical protein
MGEREREGREKKRREGGFGSEWASLTIAA